MVWCGVTKLSKKVGAGAGPAWVGEGGGAGKQNEGKEGRSDKKS